MPPAADLDVAFANEAALLEQVEDRLYAGDELLSLADPTTVMVSLYAEWELVAAHETTLNADDLRDTQSVLKPQGYSLYVFSHPKMCVAVLLGVFVRDLVAHNWAWLGWDVADDDDRINRVQQAFSDTTLTAPDLLTLTERCVALVRDREHFLSAYWAGHTVHILDAARRSAHTEQDRTAIDLLAGLGAFDETR